MNQLTQSLIIILIIVASFGLIAILYSILVSRRKSILLKKTDYLIEDLTYKSETLNSTIETVAKIANYIDVFEVIARKNIRSGAKLISRNKEDIYKILDRLKKIAIGPEKNKNSHKKKEKKK
jgi:uncharacterized protein YoxC